MEINIGLKYAKAISAINPNWKGTVVGDIENELIINWEGQDEISVADIKTKITEMETAEENEKQAKIDLKASAKAKLVAGEPLTEDEANTIVL